MWDRRAPRGLSLWQGFVLIFLTQPPGQRASGRAGIRRGASESLGGPSFQNTSVGWQAVLGAWVLSAPRTAPLGTAKWKSQPFGIGKRCRVQTCLLPHTQSCSHLWADQVLSRKCCLLSWPLPRSELRLGPSLGSSTAAEETPPPR